MMVRKLDVEELQHFAQGWGLSIAPNEQEEFKTLSDALIGILDVLDVQDVAAAPVRSGSICLWAP